MIYRYTGGVLHFVELNNALQTWYRTIWSRFNRKVILDFGCAFFSIVVFSTYKFVCCLGVAYVDLNLSSYRKGYL